MKSIVIKGNSAKIQFNPKLYRKEAILTGINDFAEVCTGTLSENEGFTVELTAAENIEEIALEFQNYILGIMKNETMV